MSHKKIAIGALALGGIALSQGMIGGAQAQNQQQNQEQSQQQSQQSGSSDIDGLTGTYGPDSVDGGTSGSDSGSDDSNETKDVIVTDEQTGETVASGTTSDSNVDTVENIYDQLDDQQTDVTIENPDGSGSDTYKSEDSIDHSPGSTTEEYQEATAGLIDEDTSQEDLNDIRIL